MQQIIKGGPCCWAIYVECGRSVPNSRQFWQFILPVSGGLHPSENIIRFIYSRYSCNSLRHLWAKESWDLTYHHHLVTDSFAILYEKKVSCRLINLRTVVWWALTWLAIYITETMGSSLNIHLIRFLMVFLIGGRAFPPFLCMGPSSRKFSVSSSNRIAILRYFMVFSIKKVSNNGKINTIFPSKLHTGPFLDAKSRGKPFFEKQAARLRKRIKK